MRVANALILAGLLFCIQGTFPAASQSGEAVAKEAGAATAERRTATRRARAVRPRVMTMKATAFSQESQPTASGTAAHEGIVAADPAVLPMGTRIQVSGAGPYDGVYLVTDKGAKIEGRHIDIYLASNREAKEFGTKRVKVWVLETGKGREDAREKDPAGAAQAEDLKSADRTAPK